MDLQTAINNINTVVRAYKGTADEHDTLRESMQVIIDALNDRLNTLTPQKNTDITEP